MKDREIKVKINEGWVHSRIIIEVLGVPKEHVEKTIRGYVEKLKSEKDIGVIKEDFSDAEKKQNFFAAFVELEIITKGPEILAGICFDYMPSSVEILEPETFQFDSLDFAQFINDLLARLHNIDMQLKNSVAEAKLMRGNMDSLMQNFAYMSLKHSPKSLDFLSKEVGIDAKFLIPVLKKMVERNVIKEEHGEYRVIKNIEI